MAVETIKDISHFSYVDLALMGSNSLALVTSTDVVEDSEDSKPTAYKGTRGFMPWGQSNNMPKDVRDKVAKSPIMSSNMLFNIQIGYGSGIKYGKMVEVTKGDLTTHVFQELTNVEEINEFFAHNNISRYLLEQLTDLNYFYNNYPELILNMENSGSRKVVELRHKEAMFSRVEQMDPKTGRINHHFYNGDWENYKEENTTPTPMLDAFNPTIDILRRIGREKYPNLAIKDEKQYRYIVPLRFPTPGRSYYSKPYWYSLIESGWYDIEQKIITYKDALLGNQIHLKYHIELPNNYFENIFSQEGIDDKAKQKDRKLKEYDYFNTMLADPKHAGKSIITFYSSSPDGKEFGQVKITLVDRSFHKGGEYLGDLEEIANIMSYGMGVHPSTVGSAPGKNKSINGTEARELFLIKQILTKPIRDMLLLPLYIIKAVNKWPDEIVFDIPNMVLTTLDNEKTGTTSKSNA